MNRLFVFGDSWAFNYFKKEKNPLRPDLLPNCGKNDVKSFVKSFDYYGHWTDYISNYYDVFNYAETGCSIESVIYQFGYLEEYVYGDRIVVIFPNNERFNWILNNQKSSLNINSPWLSQMNDNEKNIAIRQLYNRRNAWNNLNVRNDEKQFLNKIPTFFKKYNPVLLTWDIEIANKISNVKMFEEELEDITIFSESNGKYIDYHLGLKGNYKLFKFISKQLNIDISEIDNNFILKTSIKSFI